MLFRAFTSRAALAAFFTLSLMIFISSISKAQVNPAAIDIVRDKWGVPHIYGKTDADAAYGLAWANCEDDFATVQRLLLAVKGRLGEVDGKGGAVLDFLNFISASNEVVAIAYDTAFSPAYKKVVDAYRDGLNAYAQANPQEVLRRGLFPVSSQDIISQYVLTNMLLTSAYLDVQKVFIGTMKNYEVNTPSGSNAFAFDSSRTTDGKTYLAINSHQPLEGLFSWYEAHLNSEEGMNILGGLFPGGISVFLGTTPNLGWACTLNHPDMSDVYKLDMNPKNDKQYWFNDHWETLQERKKKIKVKVGPFMFPVTKTFYWSKYGTTIKNKDGYYSIRFASNMDVRSPEQLYNLNKAQNFSEWRNAMRMMSVPGVNFIYADRADTIYYVSNAQMPYRNGSYNWQGVLPGNTSQTLWPARFYSFDSLPQVIKPKSGYIVNTNNSAFDISGSGDNPNPSNYPKAFGYGLEKNNRSIMAHYLIGRQTKLSYEDMKRIKFNRDFNDSLYNFGLSNICVLMNLSPVKYPELADAINVLQNWNYSSDVNNKETALVAYTMYNLIDKITSRGTNYEENYFTEHQYVEALRHAKHHMLHNFGTLSLPLGQVQRHVRGDVDLPIGGAPEVLAATISQPYKDGKRRTYVGESYIQLVRYSRDTVEIESIHAYGASAKPGSPHYTDQMQMFVNQKLKPMTLNKQEIYKNAERIYHPVKDNKAKERGILTLR
ncbi:MAG: penicillin acylase family protein [Chitinophagales bacterium]